MGISPSISQGEECGVYWSVGREGWWTDPLSKELFQLFICTCNEYFIHRSIHSHTFKEEFRSSGLPNRDALLPCIIYKGEKRYE